MSEIFGLFLKTLTSDEKYFRRNMQVLWQQLQTVLFQEEMNFVDFWLHFPNGHEI